MATYEQPPIWYTEEEVTARLTEAHETLVLHYEPIINNTFTTAQMGAVIALSEILREDIDNGDISLEYAQAVLDTMGMKLDVDVTDINLKVKVWTVTVSYGRDQIAEFTDIEAEDEDSAIESAQDGFEMTGCSADVEFTDNNGYTHELHIQDVTDMVDMDADGLEWEATEQD